jgi:hypothetical protein
VEQVSGGVGTSVSDASPPDPPTPPVELLDTAAMAAPLEPTGPMPVPGPPVEVEAADEQVLGGRYRLGDVLGAGGMAQVHRAHDVLLGREVAVKVLRDSVDEGDRARFTTEAQLLAQLSHPALVTVLDAGVSEERPYVVMELVEGRTFAAALRDGPMPALEVARIGAQVAHALAHAHEQGVVHRDVKPANVLLDDAGPVKLADFGIARLIGDTMRHTATGTTIGTAAYISPEQVQGHVVGGASDVYSLGLMLLEALTGERAYPGTPTEAALARLHRQPDIPGHLPEPWRELVGSMVALEPSDRAGAEMVATALDWFTTHPDAETAGPEVATMVTQVAGPAPAALPRIDRTGTGAAAVIASRWRRLLWLPGRFRSLVAVALAGVVVALGVVVTMAVVRQEPAAPVDGPVGELPSGVPDDLPRGVPDRLRPPLQELHDSIEQTP